MTRWTVGKSLVILVAAATLIACGDKKAADKKEGTSGTETEAVGETKSKEADGERAKTPAALTAPPAAYQSGLKEGRAHTKANDYKKAAAAFRRAASAVPNDARANSELSWALFKADDLKGAQAAATISISNATGKLKAASLYNLGRILEARNKKDEAADAYRRSLTLRPHKVVSERLAKLDGGTPENALPTRALLGPYADLDTLCETIRGDAGDPSQAWKCPGKKTAALENEKGSYREVSLLHLETEHEFHGRLIVRTSGGWFASDAFYEMIVPGMVGASGEILNASISKAGGTNVLRIDLTSSESGRFETWETKQSVFCAEGDRNRLICTPFVTTRAETTEYDPGSDDSTSSTDSFNATLHSDGVLEVTAKGKISSELKGQLGKHQLKFE